MGTCRVIVDADAAVGFRLAGVEAVVAGSAEQAERLVRECLAGGGCGSLILVKQSYLEAFSDVTRRRIEKTGVPLVVPIPLPDTWTREAPAQDYVLNLIRRAIGYQMKITRG